MASASPRLPIEKRKPLQTAGLLNQHFYPPRFLTSLRRLEPRRSRLDAPRRTRPLTCRLSSHLGSLPRGVSTRAESLPASAAGDDCTGIGIAHAGSAPAEGNGIFKPCAVPPPAPLELGPSAFTTHVLSSTFFLKQSSLGISSPFPLPRPFSIHVAALSSSSAQLAQMVGSA